MNLSNKNIVAYLLGLISNKYDLTHFITEGLFYLTKEKREIGSKDVVIKFDKFYICDNRIAISVSFFSKLTSFIYIHSFETEADIEGVKVANMYVLKSIDDIFKVMETYFINMDNKRDIKNLKFGIIKEIKDDVQLQSKLGTLIRYEFKYAAFMETLLSEESIEKYSHIKSLTQFDLFK